MKTKPSLSVEHVDPATLRITFVWRLFIHSSTEVYEIVRFDKDTSHQTTNITRDYADDIVTALRARHTDVDPDDIDVHYVEGQSNLAAVEDALLITYAESLRFSHPVTPEDEAHALGAIAADITQS
jgi:hypothetical protein